MDNQIGIAEDLRDREKIRECQFRVWMLHKEGHSFFAIRLLLIDPDNEDARGHSTRTLWKWYQQVQKKVEEEEDNRKEGNPTADYTYELGGDVVTREDGVVAFVLGLSGTYQGKRYRRTGSHKVKQESFDEENTAIA